MNWIDEKIGIVTAGSQRLGAAIASAFGRCRAVGIVTGG